MNIKELINKDRVRMIFDLLFAILSVGGIAYYLAIGNETSEVNNIIYVPIFIIYFRIYKNIRYSKNDVLFSVFLSVFTATILVLGTELDRCSDIFWTSITLSKIIMLIFSLLPIYMYAIKFCDNFSAKSNKIKEFKRRDFFKLYVILLFFAFLGFLALYPGVYGYDAGYEIMQIQYEDVNITTHFSVVYSYVLYGFVNLGNMCFHSYTIGFAIYSFVQMCIMTFITTKICVFCYKIAGSKKMLVASTLFFCFFPLHIIMMVSSAQDTLFCGLLALLVIEAYNIVCESDVFWSKGSNMIRFVGIMFLMFLLRNNGLYIMLVPMALTVFLVKKYKIKTLALFCISITLFFVYKGPILSRINVVEADTLREMSSIPCQQIARSYVYKNDVYTEEEKTTLNNIFSYRQGELFEYYTINQCISDSVKVTIDEKYVKENITDVVKLYFNNLIEDPENYVEGFLFNSLGFWYPNKVYPDTRMYHPYIEYDMLDAKKWNERYVEIERHSLNPIYNKLLSLVVEKNFFNRVPIISSVFSCGTYFLILFFSVVYIIRVRKLRLVYPLSILIGYYLTLLLSPVCIFRYCYAFVLCAPIMISILIMNKDGLLYKSDSKKNKIKGEENEKNISSNTNVL